MTTQYNHLIVLPTHQAFMFHHYQPVHYIYILYPICSHSHQSTCFLFHASKYVGLESVSNALPNSFVLTLISFLFLNFILLFVIYKYYLYYNHKTHYSLNNSNQWATNTLVWLLIPQKGLILVLSENKYLQAITVMNSKIPLFIRGRCPTTHISIIFCTHKTMADLADRVHGLNY